MLDAGDARAFDRDYCVAFDSALIIKEHGPDAVAFYISGQLLTEDYYVFNEATLSSRVYQ